MYEKLRVNRLYSGLRTQFAGSIVKYTLYIYIMYTHTRTHTYMKFEQVMITHRLGTLCFTPAFEPFIRKSFRML